MAVPTAGLEVKAPVAADPAAARAATPVAATGTPFDITPDPGVVAAAKAFRVAFGPLRDAISQHLSTLLPGSGRRGTKVSAKQLAVTPRVAALLREFPYLAPLSDPDVIDAGLASADAMQLVVLDLQALLKQAVDTVRLERAFAWKLANAGYSAGLHHAKTDNTVATMVAPIRDALKRGPRTDSAAITTAAASHQAGKAAVRATRAQQRAQAAGQSQTRAVQAHAASHPTAGTPVPAAVYQGPAVTTPADAASNQGPAVNPQGSIQGPAVNPQGPAPGR